MTMRLELTPEVEAGLLNQAQENGMSLEAFAEQVLTQKSRAGLWLTKRCSPIGPSVFF